ncbi:lipase-like [Xenia sp. Carnegie-2017]|uniref:lipase-like n=1 Tax=Xenia sp. Carnegie-2017 TaxID=2897299 RepID=UPI001F0355B2|nr:lipase-like [Xenia sp. Carnegie-2017]
MNFFILLLSMMFFMQVYQSSACDFLIKGRPKKEDYGTPPHLSEIRFAAVQSIDAYLSLKLSHDSKLFDLGRTKGFVKNTRNEIVVSFQGSFRTVDWLRDFIIVKKSYSGCQDCKVHTGFVKAYSPLKDQMFRKLRDLNRNKQEKVLVTGHSLGGAMATLAAVDLINAGYQVDLITFGAPRVGNKAFAQYVDRIVKGLNLRVTYLNDIVTVVPNVGYRHAGQEIHCIGRAKCHVYPAGKDFCHVRASAISHLLYLII